MPKLELSDAFQSVEWIIGRSQVNLCDVYTTVIVIMILWTALEKQAVALNAWSRRSAALALESSVCALRARHHCLCLNLPPQCNSPSCFPDSLQQGTDWVKRGSLLPPLRAWVVFQGGKQVLVPAQSHGSSYALYPRITKHFWVLGYGSEVLQETFLLVNHKRGTERNTNM